MKVSNERLAEMLAGLEGVTPGPWGVWREPTFTMADAIRELTFQVESTPVEDFAKAVYLLDAGGKCPATTGCGPSSAANAAHIARLYPDTMRSILTELLSLRNAQSEAVAWRWRLTDSETWHTEKADPSGRIGGAHIVIEPLYTHPAPQSEAVAWNDAPTAPKDGTLLRLLVVPDEEAHTSFHDSETPYETIGFNQLSDTGDDEWHFAGWDWSHDCITQGYGEVIGWLPFHAIPAALTHPVPPLAVTDELALALTKQIEREFYRDYPGGVVQVRAKVQRIIAEALAEALPVKS